MFYKCVQILNEIRQSLESHPGEDSKKSQFPIDWVLTYWHTELLINWPKTPR